VDGVMLGRDEVVVNMIGKEGIREREKIEQEK
jgi:hypothetical protein